MAAVLAQVGRGVRAGNYKAAGRGSRRTHPAAQLWRRLQMRGQLLVRAAQRTAGAPGLGGVLTFADQGLCVTGQTGFVGRHWRPVHGAAIPEAACSLAANC